MITTLAAALANQGDFEAAVARQKQAIELSAEVDEETKEKLALQLKLFESGRPYRMERKTDDSAEAVPEDTRAEQLPRTQDV